MWPLTALASLLDPDIAVCEASSLQVPIKLTDSPIGSILLLYLSRVGMVRSSFMDRLGVKNVHHGRLTEPLDR